LKIDSFIAGFSESDVEILSAILTNSQAKQIK
jgi:hypothetical protein